MSDVTDWLTAVGTVGAVITSLYFSGRDGRSAAERERRRQAENITEWIEPKPGVMDRGDYLNVVVQNASSQPASHVNSHPAWAAWKASARLPARRVLTE